MPITIFNGSFQQYRGSLSVGPFTPSSTTGVVTSGSILYLDAGNASSYPGSGTTWTDLSGNSNNGTLTNGPVYTAASGGYFDLDGTNDFVSMGNPSTLNDLGAQTNIAWVYIKGSTQQPVLWYKSDGNVDEGWVVDLSNGTNPTGFGFNYVTSGNNLRYTVTYNQVPKDQWVMLAITFDGTFPATTLPGNIKIYINGIENTTTQYSELGTGTHNSDSTRTLTFGSPAGTTGTPANQYLSGSVSILQLYNRALTAAEITQNYNAFKSRYGL